MPATTERGVKVLDRFQCDLPNVESWGEDRSEDKRHCWFVYLRCEEEASEQRIGARWELDIGTELCVEDLEPIMILWLCWLIRSECSSCPGGR